MITEITGAIYAARVEAPADSQPPDGRDRDASGGWRRVALVATSFPVRLLVTIGLLAAIALIVDWDAVVDRLEEGEWGWFAGGVGLLWISLVVGAIRWHWLLTAAGLPLSYWQTTRAYFIGIFTNNFLPTGFGGDAARGFLVARGGEALARSYTSVFVDRASSIVCLLILGAVSTLVAPDDVPDELKALLAVACAAVLAAVLVAAAVGRARWFQRLMPERVRPYAREALDVLLTYMRNRLLLILVLVVGVGFQALVVGSVWMLARSIELDLSFALVAVTLPLVLVLTLFPVSIAGFGVREGGFVVLLDSAGVSASDATLLSLLSVAALALASSPGALALLTSPSRARVPESPPPG